MVGGQKRSSLIKPTFLAETKDSMDSTFHKWKHRLTGRPRSSPSEDSEKYRLEQDFCAQAAELRAQFDQVVADSLINGGMTPFTYAFCKDAYQFLTASSERIFAQNLIDILSSDIRFWGARSLGTSMNSTPHARLYIRSCRRNFARDNVSHPWHFVFSLAGDHSERASYIRIMRSECTENGATAVGSQVESLRLRFNQLLVHRTTWPYSIETSVDSMDPSEGLLLLDGYLW
jgi:hypothetical protein